MNSAGYRLGYSIPNDDDYALAKLGPALDEAAGHGVELVELPLYAIDVMGNGRIWPDRLARLKAITAGRALGYTVHGPLYLNLMADDGRIGIHKDVLKATLEVAAELGAVHYVAHSGFTEGLDAAEAESRYARQRDILSETGDFAAQHGLTIVVENLFHPTSPLPSRLAQEIASIGHPAIAACLDLSHAYLLCGRTGVDFVSEAAALAPYAKQLHVHDSFGKLDDNAWRPRAERVAYGFGDLHLPIGRGSIPWDALIDACRFPANAVLIHELAPPYWNELGQALADMRAFAQKAAFGEAG